LPFVLPKQSAATMDVNFDKMTDAEIDSVYGQLFNQVNHKLFLSHIPEAEIIPEPEIIPDALPEPHKIKNHKSKTNENDDIQSY
jgi:hypothetical protein